MSTITEIDAIREEVSVLADRLEAVEAHLGKNGIASSLPFDWETVVDDVRQITQEIFPGRFELTHEFDPEYPDDQYMLIRVEARGTPKEIVDRSGQWDERVLQLSPDLLGLVRLFIIPR